MRNCGLGRRRVAFRRGGLSPVLANLYLNPLDHQMADAGFEMVRYADDFVILCRSREEAEAALAMVRTWVEGAGLILHPDKTHIVDSREKRFSFLGYSFRGKYLFPRKKSTRSSSPASAN